MPTTTDMEDKQIEQNESASNSSSCNDVVATTNKSKEKQNNEEMPASAAGSSVASCSSSYSYSIPSNNKNVITAQRNSISDTNIKAECTQHLLSYGSDTETNSTMTPKDARLTEKRPASILLSSVNSYIMCCICLGYLIDATTIMKCLHSFCHSCLIKHLTTKKECPQCGESVNSARINIKSDTTLQVIVYKLVPGLYEKELARRREFYKDHPEDAALATPEQRGEDTEHLIVNPSDYMSISLEYADIDEGMKTNAECVELIKPLYLKCPAKCTVAHLKKLLYYKFKNNRNRLTVDIMYRLKKMVLKDHYTLMDVAYIYTWVRDAPMRFYFRLNKL